MKKKELKNEIRKYQDLLITKQEEILKFKDDVKNILTSDTLVGSDVAFTNYKIELFNELNKRLGLNEKI